MIAAGKLPYNTKLVSYCNWRGDYKKSLLSLKPISRKLGRISEFRRSSIDSQLGTKWNLRRKTWFMHNFTPCLVWFRAATFLMSFVENPSWIGAVNVGRERHATWGKMQLGEAANYTTTLPTTSCSDLSSEAPVPVPVNMLWHAVSTTDCADGWVEIRRTAWRDELLHSKSKCHFTALHGYI